MSQPVKIQINSLEALERLIGGDSALEIEVRNSIVQNFTTKHLKAIAGLPLVQHHLDYVTKATKEAVQAEVRAHVGTIKTDWQGRVESVKLNDAVRDEISLLVKNQVEKLVGEAAQATLKELTAGLQKRIDGHVKSRLDYDIAAEVKKQVSEAFQRAMLKS